MEENLELEASPPSPEYNKTQLLNDGYMQAKSLGEQLLPYFSEGGILQDSLQKTNRMKDRERERYSLAFSATAETADRTAVSKASRASLELLFKAAEAVESQGFKRYMKLLVNRESTPELALQLYRIKQLLTAGNGFLKDQKVDNPKLLQGAAHEYLVQKGDYTNLFDDERKKLYASALVEGAQLAFPRQRLEDAANPFHPFRKELEKISPITPKLMNLDNLITAVKQPETPVNTPVEQPTKEFRPQAEPMPIPVPVEA